MSGTLALPIWAVAVLGLAAAAGFYFVALVPLWRWFWDRRSQSVVERVNPHLQLKLSPFTLTRRRVLADRIANDPAVQQVVATVAAERNVDQRTLRKRAYRIAFGMVPAFNPFFYFHIGHWMARRALRSLYSVHIGFADREGLEKVGGDSSVVFFVSHRSNVDYVLVTYLTAQKTMLSFGVGEWSHIWPIQPLMRAAGGYFLHRDRDDPVYRKLLERYVQLATEAKVPHAIFPEGALSPDGRLQPPKLGLLTYITRTFDPATSPDIVIIPIGTNYDRVPEDTNILRHEADAFRQKGRSFVYRSGASISGRVLWETLRQRRAYGCACAQFGTPVSLRDWLRARWVDWPSLDREARYEWISRLVDELMTELSRLVPAPPVAVLCSVLAEGGDRFALDALYDRFVARVNCVKVHRGFVTFADEKMERAFDSAVELLCRRHVLRRNGSQLIEVIASGVPLIAFYANSIEQFVGPTA